MWRVTIRATMLWTRASGCWGRREGWSKRLFGLIFYPTKALQVFDITRMACELGDSSGARHLLRRVHQTKGTSALRSEGYSGNFCRYLFRMKH